MATAVYIQKLNAAYVPTGGTILFEQKEVMAGEVFPVQKVLEKRRADGNPEIFILSDAWLVIAVAIRFYGSATLEKLVALKNQILSGLPVRIYPKYIDDKINCYDCIASPEATHSFYFSGYYKAGDVINLEFFESNKQGQAVMDDDEFVV